MKNLATLLLASLLGTKGGSPYPYGPEIQPLAFLPGDGKPPLIDYTDDPIPDKPDQFPCPIDCQGSNCPKMDWTQSSSVKEPGSGTADDPYYATLVGGSQGNDQSHNNCGERVVFRNVADDGWVFVRVASVEGFNSEMLKLGPAACTEIGCDVAPEGFYSPYIAAKYEYPTFTDCEGLRWHNGSGNSPEDPLMVVIGKDNKEDCSIIYEYNGKYLAVFGYNLGSMADGSWQLFIKDTVCGKLDCDCGMNYICPHGVDFTDLKWVLPTTTSTSEPTTTSSTESETTGVETTEVETEPATTTPTTLPETTVEDGSSVSLSISGILALGILV